MGNGPTIPKGWTEPERWVWERIAAGEWADLDTRRPDPKHLDPKPRRAGARIIA